MSALRPQLSVRVSQDLLDAFTSTKDNLAGKAVMRAIQEYHNHLYDSMLNAPDDQLAGYRGMLLATNLLAESLQIQALQASANKGTKK